MSTDLNQSLIEALRNDDLEMVTFLLDNGADIRAQNDRAFIEALQSGDLERVEFLLDKGADVHAQNDRAFIEALQSGDLERVKFLLDNGADVHARNDSAIIIAATGGNLEITQLLIENGVDINAVDANGDTSLMHAINNRHDEIAKLLIENEVDVNVANNNDETALTIAIEDDMLEIVILIMKNGVEITDNINDLMYEVMGINHTSVGEYFRDYVSDYYLDILMREGKTGEYIINQECIPIQLRIYVYNKWIKIFKSDEVKNMVEQIVLLLNNSKSSLDTLKHDNIVNIIQDRFDCNKDKTTPLLLAAAIRIILLRENIIKRDEETILNGQHIRLIEPDGENRYRLKWISPVDVCYLLNRL